MIRSSRSTKPNKVIESIQTISHWRPFHPGDPLTFTQISLPWTIASTCPLPIHTVAETTLVTNTSVQLGLHLHPENCKHLDMWRRSNLDRDLEVRLCVENPA